VPLVLSQGSRTVASHDATTSYASIG
jgi:hypothetical protein